VTLFRSKESHYKRQQRDFVKSIGRDEDDVGSFLQGKIKDRYNELRKQSDGNYARAGEAFDGAVVQFDEYKRDIA
jgi:hypothetical protein